jgi:anti-anti-sigma regulatory factor
MIDASCLAVLFAAAARARRDGGLLVLLDPLSQVRRILDLTGAPDGVVVLDLSDEALAGRIAGSG